MDSRNPMYKHYVNAARIACRENLDCEPTDDQLQRAIEKTNEMERQADELFMYGCILNHNIIEVVEADKNVPWELSALNMSRPQPKRELQPWEKERRREYQRRYREKKKAQKLLMAAIGTAQDTKQR